MEYWAITGLCALFVVSLGFNFSQWLTINLYRTNYEKLYKDFMDLHSQHDNLIKDVTTPNTRNRTMWD